MKTFSAVRRGDRGNVLFSVIAISGIIGLALATNLTLTNNQTRLVARSQSWNAALAVAEAGVEESLTHLYKDYGTNMAFNGWAAGSSGYSKSNAVDTTSTNTLPAGKTLESLNGYYISSISSNLPYVITCTGYYPLHTTSSYLSRTVQVTTRNLGVFFGALVVKDQIDLNGNNVMTDSYDSTNPAKSTNGKYDVTKAGDKGDVASLNGLSDTLAIGNANIWGHVMTG